MSEKWWEARPWFPEEPVSEVEVAKETKSTVTLRSGRRCKKETEDGGGYFRTKEEAFVSLIAAAQENIDRAKQRLEWANDKMAELLKAKEADE